MSDSHLDETTVLRYLDGELDRIRSGVLLAHTRTCAVCRRLLESLERETTLLREALTEADGPLPARFQAAPAASDISWALLLLGAMAVGGAYWLWDSLVAPWSERLSSVGLGGSTLVTTLFFRSLLWKGWSTMGEAAFEALGLATLALAVATVALVMRWVWRYSRTAVVLLGALLAAGLFQGPLQAAEIKKGQESYTLGAGDVVHNDLIVAAGTTRIDGTVEGDLIVFSQSVTVSGRVTGDVLAFCQNLRVTGEVEGNVRSFSQFLSIAGQVLRNATAFCQDAQLEREGKIRGGLSVFAETVKTDGQVSRDLMAFAERQEIRGAIGGNALLGGARLEILPGASIEGAAVFHGGRQPEVSPEAKLARPLDVQLDPSSARSRYLSPGYYWWQAFRWAAAFLFGVVLVFLMPGFFVEVVRTLRRSGPALGFGAVTTFLLPMAALVAAITIVGLAVGLTALFLYVIALYSAQIFVGAFLGEKFLGEARATSDWLQRLALGLLAIRVAGMVPVAGVLVGFAVILLGTGALALALYRRMRPAPAPA